MLFNIVEQVSCRNRRFGLIQFAMHDLAVGIDKGLLIETTDAFELANIECILRTQIARVCSFNFTAGYIILMLAFQCCNLCIAEFNTFIGDFSFQCA